MAGGGFFQSKKFKTIMRFVYGWGAAVVIVGAMFKLLHLPGASTMLGVGLTVEAIIFFLSVFEVPHEDPDWTLVYPELAGMEGHGGEHTASSEAQSDDPRKISHAPGGGGHNTGSVSQGLDKIFEESGKIDSELIASLGDGIRNFGDKVSTIANVADVAMSTTNLSTKINDASKNVEVFSDEFSKASTSLAQIAESTTNARSYGEQMAIMTKNVTALNAIYELELNDSNNHLKAMNKLYGTMSDTIKAFSDSLADAETYRSEVSKLNKNLSALNSIYGNMLSAMNYNGTRP
jgi:gliding motility-associated protein GldL